MIGDWVLWELLCSAVDKHMKTDGWDSCASMIRDATGSPMKGNHGVRTMIVMEGSRDRSRNVDRSRRDCTCWCSSRGRALVYYGDMWTKRKSGLSDSSDGEREFSCRELASVTLGGTGFTWREDALLRVVVTAAFSWYRRSTSAGKFNGTTEFPASNLTCPNARTVTRAEAVRNNVLILLTRKLLPSVVMCSSTVASSTEFFRVVSLPKGTTQGLHSRRRQSIIQH